MNNVLEHDTAIWKRLKDNVNKSETMGRQAQELWLPIGKDLLELKRKYPSTMDFAYALIEHEIEYNKDDRAALMKIGAMKELRFQEAVELVPSRSPQWFMRAIEKDYDYLLVTSSRDELDFELKENTETVENAVITEEIVETESEEIEISTPEEVKVPAVLEKHKDAEVVLSIYKDRSHTPKSFSSLNKKDAWAMLVEICKTGLIQENEKSITYTDARIFFPSVVWARGQVGTKFLSSFDLSKTNQTKEFKEKVFPVILEKYDEIAERPNIVQGIVNAYWQEKGESEQIEREKIERVQRLQSMPQDESEVVMSGERIWPTPYNGIGEPPNYEDVRNAYRMLMTNLDDIQRPEKNHKSRAINHRFFLKEFWFILSKYFSPEEMKRLEPMWYVMGQLSYAVEKGEPTPHDLIPKRMQNADWK